MAHDIDTSSAFDALEQAREALDALDDAWRTLRRSLGRDSMMVRRMDAYLGDTPSTRDVGMGDGLREWLDNIEEVVAGGDPS